LELTIKSITNDQEHAAALEAIESLLESHPGTPDGDEFERLTKLIDEYEDIRYPINELHSPN
jgi:antitoxin component HigA of HigAB toxin-antitoxin module